MNEYIILKVGAWRDNKLNVNAVDLFIYVFLKKYKQTNNWTFKRGFNFDLNIA